jgi:hypothetical protein
VQCSKCSTDISSVPDIYNPCDKIPNPSPTQPHRYADSDYRNDVVIETIDFSGSKLSKILAVIVGVIGFFAGIGFGYIFESPGYYSWETTFNTLLMFEVWIGTVISIFPFVLAYYHFKNQETTNELLEKIAKSIDKK